MKIITTGEFIAALAAAIILFVLVKLIGLVLQLAIVAAVIGLIAGYFIARLFRKTF